MNFFDTQTSLSALNERLVGHSGLIVACYCAAWCKTCAQYRPLFEALAQRFPDQVYVWVDIEENESLLDDEEVEDFPTLLIQSPRGNLFFGTMLPQIEQLERLLKGVEALPASARGPGPLRDLVAAAAQ